MTDLDPLGRASGVAFPVLSLLVVLFATFLSPTFAWTGSALSDLGASGELTALLFDGGLVLAGLVALPFVAWRYHRGRNRLERVGALVLALGFFVAIPTALWTHAAGAYRAGRPRDAAVGLVCGALDPATWVVWGLVGQEVAPGSGVSR